MAGFHIIIPARYASSRLPGKPLLDIGGKPMLQHVLERCNQSAAESVIVATDDDRIADAVTGFGGEVVMTSPDHRSGSDRIAEAATALGLKDHAMVVNVQGDEPDMPAALIDQVAQALANDADAAMATACAPLDNVSQLTDSSVVKVVTNKSGYAIYFSRAAIPWVRGENSLDLAHHAQHYARRHLGIYAYSAGYIRIFASRQSCELENLEKLEQLRGLWHGDKICCVDAVEAPGAGIDTEADLERARQNVDKLLR
ncbi:3-deoxy-manno-octulosonate cytidylyltransferase [Candidatus Spongiihabitans sp.]|uniref:3-deoxy-manno-octulosonate cytidylyltransferase n=1 Tax=Candidatus Spongiihabitans sp. TaxID=3101308 RepID=UPI003C6F796D